MSKGGSRRKNPRVGYVFNALCQCLSKSGVPPTCRPHVLLGHFKFGAKALIPLKFTPYDAKVHTCRLAAGTRKRSGKMRAFASSVLDGFVNLFIIQIRRLQKLRGPKTWSIMIGACGEYSPECFPIGPVQSLEFASMLTLACIYSQGSQFGALIAIQSGD